MTDRAYSSLFLPPLPSKFDMHQCQGRIAPECRSNHVATCLGHAEMAGTTSTIIGKPRLSFRHIAMDSRPARFLGFFSFFFGRFWNYWDRITKFGYGLGKRLAWATAYRLGIWACAVCLSFSFFSTFRPRSVPGYLWGLFLLFMFEATSPQGGTSWMDMPCGLSILVYYCTNHCVVQDCRSKKRVRASWMLS